MSLDVASVTKQLAGICSAHASGSRKEAAAALDLAARAVAGCQACSGLAAARTQTVFGVGDSAARLVLVGEAPGFNEDRLGEPFVGDAGQLLTRILAACGLRRDDVYICNVLKCRPPQNRKPLPGEQAACRPWLEMQLAVIKPELIVCLGATAAHALLGNEGSMASLRGRLFSYRNVPVLCTYHPAYLLRTPAAKREVWEDMQMAMRIFKARPSDIEVLPSQDQAPGDDAGKGRQEVGSRRLAEAEHSHA